MLVGPRGGAQLGLGELRQRLQGEPPVLLQNLEVVLAGAAAKKSCFLETRALRPPPPSSLMATFVSGLFFELQKSSFFLVAHSLTRRATKKFTFSRLPLWSH